MKIKIQGSDSPLQQDDASRIERQLQFALSRFDSLILTAAAKVDGPECRVLLKLRSGQEIRVSDRHADLTHAARQAAQRAAAALDRQLTAPRIDRRARISTRMQFGD